jgi:hypothetical protein
MNVLISEGGETWERRWLNVYPPGGKGAPLHCDDMGHSNKQRADFSAAKERLACQAYEVEINTGKVRLV